MFPVSFWFKLIPWLMCIALGYMTYNLLHKLGVVDAELKRANESIDLANQTKKQSEQAQLELTNQVADLQNRTATVITKLVKVPVVIEEKCMSPVLLEALQDELIVPK